MHILKNPSQYTFAKVTFFLSRSLSTEITNKLKLNKNYIYTYRKYNKILTKTITVYQ